MRPRFFVPALDAPAGSVRLPAEEAHHLVKVLRLRAGDEVAVFDGRGAEFLGTVASVARDSVIVTLVRPVETAAAPEVGLTLVQGILKGDAMDAVVRDATMAGVAVIQPVTAANTTVKLSLLTRAGERWTRIALASAKQCGRSRLPEIRPAVPAVEWLAAPAPLPGFLLVEPAFTTRGTLTLRDIVRRQRPPAASLMVGPEGGWTAAEYDRATRAGLTPLTLGRLTLRADAVPIVAAAALLALWDEDPPR